jgi:hypothetical protein
MSRNRHASSSVNGGGLLGKGGFGSVHTLSDMPPGAYTAYYVNVPKSAGDKVRAYSDRLDETRFERFREFFMASMVYKVMNAPSDAMQQRHFDMDHQLKVGGAPPRQSVMSPVRTIVRGNHVRKLLAGDPADAGRKLVAKEEDVKWRMVDRAINRGAAHDVRSFYELMPLYRYDSDGGAIVFLCLQAEEASTASPGVVYPLYRYMHGDLVDFSELYTPTVGDVLAVVGKTLACLAEMQATVGAHHGDIKMENVLFRVLAGQPPATEPLDKDHKVERIQMHQGLARLLRGNGAAVEFVLSDFGSASIVPNDDDESVFGVTEESMSVLAQHNAYSLSHIEGTPGYRSPLVYRWRSKHLPDAIARQRETFVADLTKMDIRLPPGSTPDTVWESYATVYGAMHGADTDDDKPLPSAAAVCAAYAKNDLFALGIVIMGYDLPRGSPLSKLAADFVDGGRNNPAGCIMSLDAARQRFKKIVAELRPADLAAPAPLHPKYHYSRRYSNGKLAQAQAAAKPAPAARRPPTRRRPA